MELTRSYLFEYRHDDAVWAIEIMATSPEDAKERIKSLAWANYQGEIAAKVPVSGGSIIQRIASWFSR